MSDTPRTDDRVVYGTLNGDDSIGSTWVNAPFARQLERELNEANKRIELLESCNADLERIAEERNEAVDHIKRLEEAGDQLATHALAGGVPQLFMKFVENWHKAKESKP